MDLAQLIRPHLNDDELLVHNTAEMEGIIFSLIEHGKTKELSEWLERFNSIEADIGIVADTPVRSQKNIFIVAVTYASRAAVRGGLDYEIAMTISDDYLQKMERLFTYDGVFALMLQMLQEYAAIVEKLRQFSAGSHLVMKVCNYISQNIYGKVTVAQISQALFVNKSYLSAHFKKITGKSLAVYINEQKVKESQFLLTTTRKSIIDIAETLHFSSQSYFHTVFSKVTGMTPVSYRSLMRIV